MWNGFLVVFNHDCDQSSPTGAAQLHDHVFPITTFLKEKKKTVSKRRIQHLLKSVGGLGEGSRAAQDTLFPTVAEALYSTHHSAARQTGLLLSSFA